MDEEKKTDVANNIPYHSLSCSEVMSAVESGEKGLTDTEAGKRRERFGKNALKEAGKKSLIARFFAQFKDVMIIVLLVAALVSAVLAVTNPEGFEFTELMDSIIILAIVIINAIIGLIQEYKAEDAMEALKNMNKPFAKVMRDGEIKVIAGEEIVPGDIVQLDAGDTVPADLRLFSSASLKIEEAALTGESVPSEKNAEANVKPDAPLGDRHNMAYSGSNVTYGRGLGVVVATGMNTEVGKIADMLSTGESEDTPLQKQLAKTAKWLSIIVLIIAAIIFAITAVRGIVNDTGDGVLNIIISSFMIAVAIAVAAIPEGLPAVVTIVLSMGMQKMSRKNAIVKNLPAVETLGCCQVICTDKTGTLTLNKMTVKKLYANEKTQTAEEALNDSSAELLVRTMALCNDTKDNGKLLVGDPTETALVQYLIDRGESFADLTADYPRVDELPFDSIRKMMTTVNVNGGKKAAYVKGAPDILLSRCDRIMINGQIRTLTDSDRQNIRTELKSMADSALRVLAAAVRYEDLEASTDSEREAWEQRLIFVGLMGMIDPPRPEVRDAVMTCKRAGMRPIMITGDHRDTAAAIAREIGILSDGQKVMEGVEIDTYSDEEFAEIIQDYSVFARVSPENKVKIVDTYKSLDKVVAMTGDGVNDAPSIKRADIGIGMGITGTDVSKGAADMVLADDNFATIINAVEEGRKLYDNIKKAIQYLLSANIAEVLCLFIVSAIMGEDFLTPVMILWVNLVTDSLPALALGREMAERDVMAHAPRKNGGSMFSGETGVSIFVQGFIQTLLVLGSYFVGDYFMFPGEAHNGAMTMAFITLCFIQLFHAFNCKSFHTSVFNRKIFKNGFLNLSFVIGAALVCAVVLIPGVRDLFSADLISPLAWLISIGFAAAVVPLVEIQKLILRAKDA